MSKKTSKFQSIFDSAAAVARQEQSEEFIPVAGQSIKDIELSKIYRNPNQPRKYFDSKEHQKLKNSILKNGFKGAISLRPLPSSLKESAPPESEYELVYGESRFRAVEALGHDTIPAIIEDLSDQQVHRLRLDENLVRKDLNPIEEVNGLMEVAADELGISQKEVISIMDVAAHTKGRKSDIGSDIALKLKKLQDVLDYYQKGTVVGFRGKYQKLQRLPEDIKQAVREKLDWSKAVEIAPIKDPRARVKILTWAIESNPSVTSIRAKRKELRKQVEGQESLSGPAQKLVNRTNSVFKKIKTSKALKKADRRKQIEHHLAEIEKLMEE